MKPFRYLFLICFISTFLSNFNVWAKPNDTPPQLKGSGLPVPRFVTLKNDEVYVRTGPGTIYPIEWIFVRRGTPVEITAEFDTWRRVRDWEGAEGWVHQSLLSGRRAVVVSGTVRPLRVRPEKDAGVVAQMEPGVIADLDRCEKSWCKIQAGSYEGWVKREELWGVYKDEKVE